MMILMKPVNKDGYIVFHKMIKGRRFRVKRSRAFMQLHLDKKLSIFEIVHHRDEDKQNDSLKNLRVIDTTKFNEHNSIHRHAKK